MNSEIINDLRFRHHTIAMWVAHGLTPEQLQRLAGIHKVRAASLMDDPAFKQLVQYYRDHGQYKEANDVKGPNRT